MVKDKNIREITELWKEEKKKYVKKSTYAAYQLLIQNHIDGYFGDSYEVTEEQVQEFAFLKLQEGLSEKSIKDIIIVLKMILKYGVKLGLFEYKPIEVKFPPNNTKQDLEVLSKQDQKKLMDYLRNNFTFRNLGIFICLSTGMRIGEICGLRWCDVNVEDGVIMVRHTLQRIYDKDQKKTKIIIDKPKTRNSVRNIPISNKLHEILKKLRKAYKDDNFFLTGDT